MLKHASTVVPRTDAKRALLLIAKAYPDPPLIDEVAKAMAKLRGRRESESGGGEGGATAPRRRRSSMWILGAERAAGEVVKGMGAE